MTFSQHIATASLLSRLIGIPIVGVIIGFVSHAVLDSIEPQEHKFNAFAPEIDFLIIEALCSLFLLWLAKDNTIMLWTIVSAVAPDIIDGFFSLIDRTRYNLGNHLFWFHRPKETRKLTKNQTIILSLILFMLALMLV